MKAALIKILFFFLIIGKISAATLNGEFIPAGAGSIAEGDIFEGIIRIWPLEKADHTIFKQLENDTLFNAFYVAEISSIDVSANNADVLEIKGLFIAKNNKMQPSHPLVIGQDTVDLIWKGSTIKELNTKNKDFFIENQSWKSTKKWWLIVVVIAILVAAAFYFWKRFLRQWFKKEKVVYTPAFFDEMFRAASTREEFERIYALKEHWMPLLKTKAPAHFDFIKTINQHQYKKRWGTEELTDVKASFDIIRRSFSL